MAFAEFYISHGAGASDTNGGSVSRADDGPIITNTNCSMTEVSAGVTYDIENQDDTGWGALP